MDKNETKQTSCSISFETLYVQAHETRRKWESYIWQWGILLTVLLAVFIGWKETSDFHFPLIQKLILTLVTFFVFTVYLNVLRAQKLMKEIEKTISAMHKMADFHLPIIPLELNSSLHSWNKVSSTKVAVYCHLLATVVFVFITIYTWIKF